MNWKDVGVRAAKTAVQTFLATFPVSAVVDLNIPALKAAALAAGAAGLSVLWNAALAWSESR